MRTPEFMIMFLVLLSASGCVEGPRMERATDVRFEVQNERPDPVRARIWIDEPYGGSRLAEGTLDVPAAGAAQRSLLTAPAGLYDLGIEAGANQRVVRTHIAPGVPFYRFIIEADAIAFQQPPPAL